MEANTISQISCVSLGMLIMDEIRMPNKSPLLNVIGGSSTFVTLGLRLFAGCPSSVGCLILAGSDLPPEVENEVRSWGTTLVLKKDATKPSSRGLLVYEDDTFGPKTFEYVTPPIRASPKGLEGTPLLNATAFHFFGRPEEIIEQVPQLLYLREEQSPELPRPFIVWEPLPSSCTPTAIPDFHAACKLVDVISPNHLEFAALFFWDRGHQSDGAGTLERLKNLGKVFVDSGIGPDGTGTMVIRAGADGALALRRNEPAVHVPAYYEHGDEKVVDPTGAGNAFLGGYIAGWLREGDVREALCYGAVAASLALEQIGLPRRGDVNAGLGEERLEEFRARMENAEWTDDA
ncbi:pfkB family kinase [Macroventuria anomochaeta]|uniref:PfkB family kinase n=1 Tax=Macroventuria anomochaeta TaxID=301207 RepID=A0ACB6RM97_9PLEO|nr:pfkB family kinase [Macroventuria anomochaeta]KAF2622996.1 pfkB family kinase [Macroventuria anomochaeta]